MIPKGPKTFAIVVLVLALAGSSMAGVPPEGFSDTLVAPIPAPTAIAFTPDGRMLVTTQPGRLMVLEEGSTTPTVALDLSAVVCSNSERGLLGVAIDPDFTKNRRIYLFYTFNRGGPCPAGQPQTGAHPVNRVARFRLPAENVIDPTSERVLIDNIPSPNGNHNGGDLNFGPQKALFVSVGDGGCDYAGGGCGAGNDAARDLNTLVGKMLRVKRNGTPYPKNPFAKKSSARCGRTGGTTTKSHCREIFTTGLRNPYRFAFDPTQSRFYINDVGQSSWEEIDEGMLGADYGWNLREGHCTTGSTTDCPPPPAELTDPIFDYGRDDGCTTITGGAFVPPGVWPALYDDSYLFADFGCGKIFRLQQQNGGFESVEFASELGPIVHLEFGTFDGSQGLYYTTYASGGEVRRISFDG